MGYIHNNLLKDENVLYWTKPHWIIFSPAVFLAVFSLLVLIFLPAALSSASGFIIFGMPIYKWIAFIVFILAIFQGIKSYILYQTSEYGITNKRIIMKTGWVQRRSLEIFLDKIEAIYVDQSIPGRMLSFGTIVVVGTGGTKDPFLYVPLPLKFRNMAQQQIDIEETKRQHG